MYWILHANGIGLVAFDVKVKLKATFIVGGFLLSKKTTGNGR